MGGGHTHSHQHSNIDSAEYPEWNFSPGAKWIKGLIKDRTGNFSGGHFSDVNLSSALFTHRLDDSKHIELQRWSAPNLTKPTFEEALKQDFQPAKKGESIGPSCDSNHWYKITVHVPSEWNDYERVQFEFDPGCEAMIYTVDGTPLQGITGGFGGDRRVEYIIPPEARKKGTHSFVAEASCNGMFGVPWNGDIIQPPDPNRNFQLASADLVVPNMPAWGLLWDFTALRELIGTLPGNSTLQNKALTVANAIMNAFYKNDPESIPAARKLADEVFGEKWEERGEGIYEIGPKEAQVWGIGHCHIDTAWCVLWPYRVTQQKVARSWSTQVDLMDRYPEHRFACSSAQQFKWLEQLYPPLFERVREKVLAGQFYPIGGSWVENDANMPSGEALARQLILGQRYFESRFGLRSRVAWLPDSFGLTGALPQIIRGAGMNYFFTQKLSWNNINVFPHSTFNWVGIDGTQVLCHMTPVDTYTAQATAGDINKALTNHKNLESSSTSLLVFGNGDGGGGPLAKMLENLRRLRGTANTSRELPVVHMGRSVDEFFDHLKTSSDAGRKLPNWRGELYLEFHRGTYTSHGSIKKGNRKSEILLRDAEHVATLASIFKGDGYKYPKQTLNDSWEKVLLNQFHDEVPTSSGMVYEDAEKLYAEVRADTEALIDSALRVLYPGSLPLSSTPASGPLTLFAHNTTPFARQDIVRVPLGLGISARDVLQTTSDGKEGYVVFEGGAGGGLVAPGNANFKGLNDVTVDSAGDDHFVLKNRNVQLIVSGGRIKSLFDVQLKRELIPQGQTGGMVIYEDRPNYWDAWDVEIHHLEKPQELKFTNVKIVATGPLRAAVETEIKYGKSSIKVTVMLIHEYLGPPPHPLSTLHFSAEVDWHERHEFLKFKLPLDIHSDVATYETPWGHVQRPTHKNTTWDAAKFEVCGHKFTDLSEYGYGVAILSESKYGFSCQGNVLQISLLRAATAPDAEQDQGKHEFSWGVLPHRGHFLQSFVPIAAYLFNSPLHVRYIPHGGAVTAAVSRVPFLLFGRDSSVILETFKRGDLDSDTKDGPRTIVLRLYEAYGGHVSVHLQINVPGVVAAYATNLLEDDVGAEVLALERTTGEWGEQPGELAIPLTFRGFEVKTIKLVLEKEG
ncbi:glycosyl hydrolases family 38 N-terminal domain-containing protein [Multifurca ochricompacta]|uniref:Alpha-mannosidase n=1 Tax=Multifurca ochricompacta TaxID=376703 RepID=A0AAD4LYB4_9AGAM|nr:glycosyl hydrolases family 38 N-terminal domain-containing protein [Multifurca ochricompacta]